MKQIRILGAGLSGLTAAINLAQAGYPVDVFEKRSDCGARFKGDLEGLENWAQPVDINDEFHHLNLGINFDCEPFKKMLISNGQKAVDISSDIPLFYLVKRGTLPESIDQGLKKQALDAGVDIHFHTKKTSEKIDIIASGPAATKVSVAAKGIQFTTDHPDVAVALVGNATSYKGYSYLLVSKGYGCICTVCFHDLSKMNTYLSQTINVVEKQFHLQISDEKPVGGVGSFYLPFTLERQGTLYTGEAAGLQDFLWGFGMRYALTSGYLAAQSIIHQKSYSKLVRHLLYPTLKASVVNRFYVLRLSDYGTFLFEKAQTMPSEKKRSMMQKMYNYSYRKRLLYPFAYYLVKKYLC